MRELLAPEHQCALHDLVHQHPAPVPAIKTEMSLLDFFVYARALRVPDVRG